MTPIKIPMHKMFLPLINSDKKYIGAESGRAAGKSWNFARAAIIKVRNERNTVFGCFKGTLNSIEDSVYKVIETQIRMLGLEDEFVFTKKNIIHKHSKSYFIFKGLQNVGRLQSTEDVKYAWVEEAQFDYDEHKHDLFTPTIRTPGWQIWYSYNPNLKEDFIYNFFREDRPDSMLIKLDYRDNPFLRQDYLAQIEYDMVNHPSKYEHVWLGNVRKEIEGALFKSEWMRYGDAPQAAKTVIAIDPATTSNTTSDECGLVAVSYKDGTWYVIDDQSRIATPKEWASLAIDMYYEHQADKIIYESNQGGDMTKTIIHQIDNTILVNGVHAKKGKLLRAEPVAALYQQGLVIHTKKYPKMEYEMVTYTGDGASPNRLDALVYGVTSLIKPKTKNPTNVAGLWLN